MLSAYCEPCTLNALFLILPVTLVGGCYSSHFRDEEIETQKLGSLPKGTTLISGRTAIKTQVCLPPTPVLRKA